MRLGDRAEPETLGGEKKTEDGERSSEPKNSVDRVLRELTTVLRIVLRPRFHSCELTPTRRGLNGTSSLPSVIDRGSRVPALDAASVSMIRKTFDSQAQIRPIEDQRRERETGIRPHCRENLSTHAPPDISITGPSSRTPTLEMK